MHNSISSNIILIKKIKIIISPYTYEIIEHMYILTPHNVYKVNSIIMLGENGDYYVIYEYYEDATGIQTRTERIYGVNVQDGTACRITYDEQGQIVLVDI